MAARNLLIVSAVVETSIGVTLLLLPSLVAGLLLGASLETPAAVVVGRMTGAALLSLGSACWLARDDGPSRAGPGLVVAMLLYNGAAVAVLANAGAGMRLAGVLMWPTVALHGALAIWCVECAAEGAEFRAISLNALLEYGTLDQDQERSDLSAAAIDISYLPVATGRRPP